MEAKNVLQQDLEAAGIVVLIDAQRYKSLFANRPTPARRHKTKARVLMNLAFNGKPVTRINRRLFR